MTEETRDTMSALTRRNLDLESEVAAAAAARRAEVAARDLPRLGDYLLPRLEAEIRESVAGLGLDATRISVGPPTGKVPAGAGRVDLAFNVAGAAKAAGANPIAAAGDVCAALGGLELIDEAFALGPFVNLRVNAAAFAAAALEEVADRGVRHGWHREHGAPLTVLDYSHPNIAKNMTVAHLRSTIIGHSLYKIHEATGAASFSVNHLGDWGTQFGKLLYEYDRANAEDPERLASDLEADPTATLMRLYREFVEREDTDVAAAERARELFLELERGDPALVELWNRFREWSLRDFAIVYERLRVGFDAYQGESFYEDRMAEAVEEALERGVIVRRPDGAVVFPSQPVYDPMAAKWLDTAMVDQDGEPRDEIVLKPTGGTVYLTRDLAAIRYRTQALGAEKLLYVIGKEQRIHCLVLFTMAEQLGYIRHGQALHTAFGHLNVEGRKMRSRAGRIVLLNDLIDAALAAATELARERGAAAGLDAAQQAEVARKVGIGSLIYNDLRQDRQTDIEFNPDVAGSLEAGQGPYIQYAYARLRSITDKFPGGEDPSVPAEPHATEMDLFFHLAGFPGVVAEAAARNAPHRVAAWVNRLAQLSNAFYHARSIKDAAEPERSYLLAVVKAAQRGFESASELLHMELPEQM